jgi:hypothetical protein
MRFRLAAAAGLLLASAGASWALPTMARLGYVNCVTCHYSPQGGGPLNEYGRGIDAAQSLLGGEYQARDDVGSPTGGGARVTHDLRSVLQGQMSWVGEEDASDLFRPRLMYRNVTRLGDALRLAAVVTADGYRIERPAAAYDPPTSGAAVIVNTALIHFKAGETFELSAGRDQLPTGVNVPDLGVYVRSRNRLGYYDTPTQLKAHWWGRRHAVVPFVYGPGGNERTGEHEWGGGGLFEYDLLGGGKTVMVGNLIRDQFLEARNWPFGAVLALSVVGFLILLFSIQALVARRINGGGARA